MSLLQFNFWIFLCILIPIYYVLPKRFQWICLLVGSYIFYIFAGIKTIVYILFTTISVWYAALQIDKIKKRKEIELAEKKEYLTSQERKNIKVLARKKQRIFFWSALGINFAILGFLKYFNFISENANKLIDEIIGSKSDPILLGLLLPLGISFYTFQSMSYLIDVYNGKYEAEKNLPKFALFVSFFPQILQGPINRFDKLSNQLYEYHKFDLENFQYGFQLILWGVFKKLVVADRALTVVNQVFNNHSDYGGGVIVFGVLLYSLQQYADFSGGIDIAMGVSELFGIKMLSNFKRPYFSTSLSEFWRRWHITLGAWMRDYIFYPLALTKFLSKVSKIANKYLGRRFAKIVPVAFSNIVVFIVVGIWHGPYWHYIVWGLYNGIIIAISAFLEPLYMWMKKVTKVNTKSFFYRLFQIFRTFFIVNLGWYFDRGNYLKESLDMLHTTITNFEIDQLRDGTIFKLGIGKLDFKILILSTIIIFIVSVIQERGIEIRRLLGRKNLIIRWMIFYTLIFGIIGFAYSSGQELGGFIYAQF